jgi:threonine/homoserine/homoserine lactone efflux protein
MHIELLLQAIVLGFSIAAPVGPIGVLCIRRTLAHGRRIGFVSGLGAATADGAFALMGGLGMTALSALLVQQQMWLRLIGGAFLCWLGLRTFLAKPASQNADAPDRPSVWGAYGSTVLLTFTNPATIIMFAGLFAGMSQIAAGGAAWFALGIFAGSALWWLLLAAIAGVLRRSLSPNAMMWINRVSGMVIFAFGFAAIASALALMPLR